mgnify:CR=1 FL=1
MNKMRLTRDKKWFFQYYPYHQMYMDNELFKGWVSINYLTDGQTHYWEYEKSGRISVCGEGMIWLTLIPEGKSRCIGAYIKPDRRVNAWYIDVIESVGIDDDGVVYYIDKYLDVVLTPQGDVVVKDRDELDEAYSSGELSVEQYENALYEGELIIKELASDIKKTESQCLEILNLAEKMIENDKFTIFLDIDGVLDVFNSSLEIQQLIPQAIDYLKDLIKRTKGEVVIISDWRYGAPQFEKKAKENGFERRIKAWKYLEGEFEKADIKIKGITLWDEAFKTRTEEIKEYLKQNSNIKRYVILDDCYSDRYESDEEIHKHLVFVDALKGLQLEDCIKACAIMNMQ